jgi:hypothetical protein
MEAAGSFGMLVLCDFTSHMAVKFVFTIKITSVPTQVSLATAEPCVKMKAENIRIKLLFL